MLRIVRDETGQVHLQSISTDGVFELVPTADDAGKPDGLYDDDFKLIKLEQVPKEFDPDQPRDEDGKWTEGGGGGEGSTPTPSGGGEAKHVESLQLTPHHERVFTGESVPIQSSVSKQETGRIGEAVALAYVRDVMGHKDANVYGLTKDVKAADMIGDHILVEVKGGLASNGYKAQRWRASQGEPGKKEQEWRKTASAKAKLKLGQKKQQAIMQRKQDLLKRKSQEYGVPIRGKTVASILNPDTKTADVYVFDGFHDAIYWNSDQAKAAYAGTYRYAAKGKGYDPAGRDRRGQPGGGCLHQGAGEITGPALAGSASQSARQQEWARVKAESLRLLKDWNEDDHPRDEAGRFTDAGGGGGGSQAEVSQPAAGKQPTPYVGQRHGDKFGGKPIYDNRVSPEYLQNHSKLRGVTEVTTVLRGNAKGDSYQRVWAIPNAKGLPEKSIWVSAAGRVTTYPIGPNDRGDPYQETVKLAGPATKPKPPSAKPTKPSPTTAPAKPPPPSYSGPRPEVIAGRNTSAEFVSSVQAGVNNIPLAHAQRISARVPVNAVFSTDDLKRPGLRAPNAIGMFSYGGILQPQIHIAQTQRFQGQNLKIKQTQATTIHELGHALDYLTKTKGNPDWGISNDPSWQTKFQAGIKRAGNYERLKANYWFSNSREQFAELYSFVHNTEASASFFGGMSQARVAQLFPEAIEYVRNLK